MMSSIHLLPAAFVLIVIDGRAAPISNKHGVITQCPPCHIFLFVGETLELDCVVTNSTLKSYFPNATMVFERGNGSPAHVLDKRYTSYHDNYTLHLSYNVTSVADESTYSCYLVAEVKYLVGLRVTVRVDHFPVAPRNLMCEANERLEWMVCSWADYAVFRHPEMVKYSLEYVLSWAPQYNSSNSSHRNLCPNYNTNTSCRWTVDDSVFFRVQYIIYLSVINIARNVTDVARFSVIPSHQVLCDSVKEFQATDVSSRCVTVTWRVLPQENKTYQLTFSRASQSSTKEDELTVDGLPNSTLCHLSPFTTYVISIRCRVPGGILWGSATSINITTKEDYPEPPAACSGCFVVADNGGTTIFWKAPKQEGLHGILIGYSVWVIDGDSRGQQLVQEVDNATTSVLVDNLHPDKTYELRIKSRNRVGCSNTSAKIIRTSRNEQAAAIRNVRVQVTSPTNFSTRTLTVLWEVQGTPPSHPDLTVVWCTRARASPGSCGCQGELSWQKVTQPEMGSITLQGNVTDTLYGLTASSPVNTQLSSGIVWADCPSIVGTPMTDISWPLWLIGFGIILAAGVLVAIICASRRVLKTKELEVTYPQSTPRNYQVTEVWVDHHLDHHLMQKHEEMTNCQDLDPTNSCPTLSTDSNHCPNKGNTSDVAKNPRLCESSQGVDKQMSSGALSFDRQYIQQCTPSDHYMFCLVTEESVGQEIRGPQPFLLDDLWTKEVEETGVEKG